MEKDKSRYLVLGFSDGLLLAVGFSLGVYFFKQFNLTFVAILLAGVSGALSNLFSTFSAENFVSGEKMLEYKTIMFAPEYQPKKLKRAHSRAALNYAFVTFAATLAGSLIVLLPYLFTYLSGIGNITVASASSVGLSFIAVGVVGAYNVEGLKHKLKDGSEMVLFCAIIAVVSSALGFLLSSL